MAIDAHDVPKRYLDAVNAGDPEALSRLFTPEAVFRGPDGRTRVGRQAICDLYTTVFQRGRPDMTPGRVVVEDRRIAFELINRKAPPNPDDPATAMDLVEIDADGLIASFVVFTRPTALPG